MVSLQAHMPQAQQVQGSNPTSTASKKSSMIIYLIQAGLKSIE